MKRKPFNSFLTKATLLGVATCVSASSAMAALVCASPGISVPNTLQGVYINLVTGATGTAGGTTAGWDYSAYGNSTGLNFYLPPNGAMVGTGTVAGVVASGAQIGPASTFTTNSTSNSVIGAAAFLPGGTRMAGLRFLNEATSATNYAWIELTTTTGTGASSGFPATINRFCYDNQGAAVVAGTTPVSLQNFSVD